MLHCNFCQYATQPSLSTLPLSRTTMNAAEPDVVLASTFTEGDQPAQR
jgi:hypothetical protein